MSLLTFLPSWAIGVGVVGLAILAAIIVFGGRDW